MYLYIDSKLTEETYAREMRIANPFIMGISVFMGYYAFDLQGIFYGPLLICIVRIVYKALRALDKKNENNKNNGSEENDHGKKDRTISLDDEGNKGVKESKNNKKASKKKHKVAWLNAYSYD